MIPRLFIALACFASAHAATYYVATNGNNANPGTIGSPWLTLDKANHTVAAGDTVNVGPGTYNEAVVNRASGTAGNVITFQGTRGSSGEWLTIIDPSTDASTGWVAAPEIGTGVYKQTFSYVVRNMNYNDARVCYAWTNGNMRSDFAAVFDGTTLTNGTDALTIADNTVFNMYPGALPVNFWDCIGGVIYCPVQSNKLCYIKFRDGSSPNGRNIRVVGNSDSSLYFFPVTQSLLISGFSYLTIKDFAIRGGFADIAVSGSTSHHDTIISNYLSAAGIRIYMDNGCHDNVVQNNVMEEKFIGQGVCPPGAFQFSGGSVDAYKYQELNYKLSKYMMGHGTQHDTDFVLEYPGTNNLVMGNTLQNGQGDGLFLQGVAGSQTNNTLICSNVVQHHSSANIFIGPYTQGERIYDNFLGDGNLNIRYGTVNQNGDSNRTAYVYRNCFWEPPFAGEHIFFHIDNSQHLPSDYYPYLWHYQNSFSGGQDVIHASSIFNSNGGCKNAQFINNISSGSIFWQFTAGYSTNSTFVGSYDYNLVNDNHITPANYAWWGSHNLTNSTPIWSTNSNPTSASYFALSAGSKALDAAVDTTTTFSAEKNITNAAALPQDSTVKVGAGWDMGALERSAIYYVSTTGNDSNPGTSTNAPWAHCPQMKSFTGSYTHTGGDHFIFRGGDTWGTTNFQMRLREGGTSEGVRDYYGVDTNWFTGGSWSKPVFDFQWTTVTNKEGLTGNENSAGVLFDGHNGGNEVSFVTFDRIVLQHHLGDPTFGNCTLLLRGHYTFNTFTGCDFLDWDIGNVATDQSNSGGIFQKDNLVAINDNNLTNCTFSCQNSTNKTGIAVSGWYGQIANCQFHDLSNMLLGFSRLATGNRFWNQVHCANTNLHDNAVYWQSQGSFAGNVVSNCVANGIYVSSLTYTGGLCNTNSGSGMALIYNNVVSGIGAQASLEVDQEGTATSNFGVWAWNNTLQRGTGPAIRVNAKAHMAFFGYGNNHLIGQTNSVQIDNSAFIDQPVVSFNNLTQTEAVANGQGYVNSNSYAPTSAGNSTVGAGSNSVSPYFTLDILGNVRSPLWDIGAYNLNATAPPSPTNVIVNARIVGARL